VEEGESCDATDSVYELAAASLTPLLNAPTRLLASLASTVSVHATRVARALHPPVLERCPPDRESLVAIHPGGGGQRTWLCPPLCLRHATTHQGGGEWWAGRGGRP
jgi:hypothetical protein